MIALQQHEEGHLHQAQLWAGHHARAAAAVQRQALQINMFVTTN
jgi:hypothetical protein